MRIVAVNAKVTFVLWLLEFVAVFFIAIAWVFIAGSTNSGSLLKHEPGQTISSASRRGGAEVDPGPAACHVSRVTCHVT